EPACVPLEAPPPVETTLAPSTPTTAATSTTAAAAAPYTFSLTCAPLQGTFTAGPRDIVIQGGFGGGGTPQTVVPAGTTVTLSWLSSPGEVYRPIPEVTFGVVDAATAGTLDEQHLVLDDECPGGRTDPTTNPLNIRWDGFTCDESQTMSGWSSMLVAIVRHDGPADAPGVQVVFENQDGTLGVDDMANMNPGASTGLAWVGWPRVSTVYPSIEFHTFRDSTRVSVRYQGQEILVRTFTLDDVRRETPACIPVIDTPGVPG
ncbi:MAG TPA: hypothetical protein VFT09_06260, partial [Ilumatobacteraceae bacterium]|nr:hypothetical protein [Ilumatobacteraceae bacterium]